MRKRIWRMSEDQFDVTRPQVQLQQERIELTGYAGEKVEGSFLLQSVNDVPMRGVCYSTHPYVAVLNPQFEGKEAMLRFAVINTGFREGDVITGSFCVAINQNELRLPFSISFVHRYPESSAGRVDRIEVFTELCRNHWNEALKLFFSDSFLDFIRSADVELRLLYKGFRRAAYASANLEEFLIAAGQKERVTFSLDDSDRVYYGVNENQKETFEITKSSWGYIAIDMTCDADFMTVEKEHITSDFFVGSQLSLAFYIHKERLHAGKNYARITFDSPGVHKEIRIMATVNNEFNSFIPTSRLHKKRTLKLVSLYKEFRKDKISTEQWVGGSIELLDQMIEEEDGSNTDFYRLQKAQALIVSGQREEALWIIQELRRTIEDKKSMLWAFLLYLCTLIEKDEAYVDRLTREIELIFLEKEDDWRIFWFLLFLRKDYIDDTRRKLNDIRRWIMAGFESPYLYIEASYLIRQDAYLFTSFDDFYIKLIRWTLRSGNMNLNLSMQLEHVLEGEKDFRKEVFGLAAAAYAVYPTEELIHNIIAYLLKNRKYGGEFLPWYALAIERGMNFTGLYEAYVLSLPLDAPERLPEMVILYFRYQNTLPVDRKAYVYANVITHYVRELRVYEQYIRNIETFALEQMRRGRMDDNMAVIYRHIFFDRGVIDDDVADAMSTLLFIRKLICFDPQIRRVMVFEEQLKEPYLVPVENNSAFLPIYSRNYRIFLEDTKGRLISGKADYIVEELLPMERMFGRLYRMAKKRLGYFLFRLNEKETANDFKEDEMNDIAEFLSSDAVDVTYRQKMYPLIVSFLQDHGREEIVEEHFLSLTDYEGLDSATISYIIDLNVMEDRYERAYEMLRSYNGTYTTGKCLLRMCNHLIGEGEEKADDFLLGICTRLMRKFLSSEDTIRFMNRYFIGPTSDMLTLWQFALARQLETRALEERILTQMLFTENIDVTSEAIFKEYERHRGNPMLMEAYTTFWSYKYMTARDKVPGAVFETSLAKFKDGEHLNESMRYALMKYLAGKTTLSNAEYKALDELVGEAVIRNVYFKFMRTMDHSLIVKYHLYDKLFAEYTGERGRHLVIRFSKDGGEVRQLDMIEMYRGIYLRQFVIFFGEQISYEIYDIDEPETVLQSETLVFDDVTPDGAFDRYDLLNRMQRELIYFNEKELLNDMKRYKQLEFITDRIFSTL